jgi:predicted MFS family arabinose efflux permease
MEELVPISIFAGLFITICYITFLKIRKAERLALISAGRDAGIFTEAEKQPSGHSALKYGIFMIGLAFGILVGNIVAKATVLEEPVAYFSMVLLFGGAALLLYYRLQGKLKKSV